MNNPDKIYTTEELTKVLEKERNACIKGERTFPMPDNAEEIVKQYPMGRILGAQSMFEIGVYHEFREQVQKYQLENNISGLEIKEYLIGEKTYKFPVPVDQLRLTKDDYQVLRLAKESIVESFLEWCDDSTYLSLNHELKNWDLNVETTKEYVRYFSSCCDWAEITKDSEFELTLQIGYGDFHDAPYIDPKDSDTQYFSATKACPIR
jgi:hypothetical protein